MTQHAQDRDSRQESHDASKSAPCFKPVALPALAAAVRTPKPEANRPKETDLPAILRKQAILD